MPRGPPVVTPPRRPAAPARRRRVGEAVVGARVQLTRSGNFCLQNDTVVSGSVIQFGATAIANESGVNALMPEVVFPTTTARPLRSSSNRARC